MSPLGFLVWNYRLNRTKVLRYPCTRCQLRQRGRPVQTCIGYYLWHGLETSCFFPITHITICSINTSHTHRSTHNTHRVSVSGWIAFNNLAVVSVEWSVAMDTTPIDNFHKPKCMCMVGGCGDAVLHSLTEGCGLRRSEVQSSCLCNFPTAPRHLAVYKRSVSFCGQLLISFK